MKKTKPKTAEEVDRRFDEGEDIISLGFDVSKPIHVSRDLEKKRQKGSRSRPAKPHTSKA